MKTWRIFAICSIAMATGVYLWVSAPETTRHPSVLSQDASSGVVISASKSTAVHNVENNLEATSERTASPRASAPEFTLGQRQHDHAASSVVESDSPDLESSQSTEEVISIEPPPEPTEEEIRHSKARLVELIDTTIIRLTERLDRADLDDEARRLLEFRLDRMTMRKAKLQSEL